uniref:Uncharacterized protein n=1 Tax=Branchiostoma floridae TaxID=7739 RepID=C3YNP6_BRAFL|eukprot:XP_002601994.1 hypothetical protein BRAFLDRAFT_123196 [Branchiostoma floridae]
MSALGAARSDADTDSEVGERCSVSSSSPEREPGAGRKSRKQRLLGYFKKKAKPRWPFLAEKSSKSQGTTKLKRDPRLTCSQPDIAHQGYGADSPLVQAEVHPNEDDVCTYMKGCHFDVISYKNPVSFGTEEICGNCAHLARSSATLGRPRPGSRCMTSWLGSCDWLTRPGSSEMAGNPAAIMVIRDAPPDSGNNGPGGSEQ